MKNKIKDAIYGLAIGDAMGVPFEFQKRGTFSASTMVGYGTHNQPAGTWSDDTSMTLATCDSIKELGYVDPEDIGNRFLDWCCSGKYAIDNNVFDIGNTTHQALSQGKGFDDFYSNGNGSLMRILPLAFANVNSELISEVSAITHGHSISTDICCQYVSVAKQLLNGADILDAISSCGGRIPTIYQLDESEIKSTGFVVDSFEAAIWSILTTDNFRDAIIKAINLGDDTDTIGAITGGLAGIIYGFENIPDEWVEKLRGKDLIDACLF